VAIVNLDVRNHTVLSIHLGGVIQQVPTNEIVAEIEGRFKFRIGNAAKRRFKPILNGDYVTRMRNIALYFFRPSPVSVPELVQRDGLGLFGVKSGNNQPSGPAYEALAVEINCERRKKNRQGNHAGC